MGRLTREPLSIQSIPHFPKYGAEGATHCYSCLSPSIALLGSDNGISFQSDEGKENSAGPVAGLINDAQKLTEEELIRVWKRVVEAPRRIRFSGS